MGWNHFSISEIEVIVNEIFLVCIKYFLRWRLSCHYKNYLLPLGDTRRSGWVWVAPHHFHPLPLASLDVVVASLAVVAEEWQTGSSLLLQALVVGWSSWETLLHPRGNERGLWLLWIWASMSTSASYFKSTGPQNHPCFVFIVLLFLFPFHR
jgi:hypothetical protein